jgi:hypothetical protein
VMTTPDLAGPLMQALLTAERARGQEDDER